MIYRRGTEQGSYLVEENGRVDAISKSHELFGPI
jgi:hypothetical protein